MSGGPRIVSDLLTEREILHCAVSCAVKDYKDGMAMPWWHVLIGNNTNRACNEIHEEQTCR